MHPLWQLQPGAHQWVVVGQLPFAIGEHALVALEGALYLIGGRTESGASNQLWRYQTGEWTRLADIKVPKHSFASATRPGQLWVMGGCDGRSDGLATVETYDTATDEWQTMPDLPLGSGGAVATSLRGEIHIAGGELLSKSSVFDQHWRFDLDQNQWVLEDPIPVATHGAAATNMNQRMYLIGGATRAGLRAIYSVSNRLWIFEPDN